MWHSPFLQTAQRAMEELYETCMMLGSVTSPALEGGHDSDNKGTTTSVPFNDDHNLAKTAAHLEDAEHHHMIMTATNGQPQDHMVRSEAVRVVHKHSVRGLSLIHI